MHAMMEPEQILEHARAAEAAGAHRFCMVTQGQGLSKRDFDKFLEGMRLVAERDEPQALRVDRAHERRRARRRCKRGRRPARAPQRRDGRVLLRRGLDDRPLRGPAAHDRGGARGRPRDLRRRHPQPRRVTRAACRDGLRAGGDRPHQRADQPARSRRPGRSSATASILDPWEAVKWIAIFRLMLPDALFRLCGGRVENLGELQPLAVKAGVNGVMMGNFLTTLGNTPAQDRAMFEDAGLNIAPPARQRRQPAARQPHRLASTARRPTSSRSSSTTTRRAARSTSTVQLWDPSTQLRFARARRPSRRDRRRAEPLARSAAAGRRAGGLSGRARRSRTPGRAARARPLPPHAHGQRAAGPARRARRQAGAAAVLEQLPRPRRPSARARGGRRRGDALGRRRGRVAPGLAAR